MKFLQCEPDSYIAGIEMDDVAYARCASGLLLETRATGMFQGSEKSEAEDSGVAGSNPAA